MTVATAGATDIGGSATITNSTVDASLRVLASVNLTAGQRAQIWSIVRYAQNAGLPSDYVQEQIASILTTQQFISLHPELQHAYSGTVRGQSSSAGQIGDDANTQSDIAGDGYIPGNPPAQSQPRGNYSDSTGVRDQIALGSAIAKIQLFNELATTA